MQFELALQEWGAQQLETSYRKVSIDRSTVKVAMEFDQGYACCGGRDPDCYCSFAESPSASVEIIGFTDKGTRVNYSISHWDFDFASILQEIVAAGGGIITSWPSKEA